MNMKQEYTLTIFTENRMGILGRIVGIITRRHINIESLSASESSIDGIYKLIVVIKVDYNTVRKVTAQIDKQIDVLKSFYYDNSEIVFQEMALYKIPSQSFYNGNETESLVRKHNAKILRIEEKYIVIEKTGYPEQIYSLLDDLKKSGVYEFIRSGRVAIVKEMERLNTYLQNIKSQAN